jgi:hypothetical protein
MLIIINLFILLFNLMNEKYSVNEKIRVKFAFVFQLIFSMVREQKRPLCVKNVIFV